MEGNLTCGQSRVFALDQKRETSGRRALRLAGRRFASSKCAFEACHELMDTRVISSPSLRNGRRDCGDALLGTSKCVTDRVGRIRNGEAAPIFSVEAITMSSADASAIVRLITASSASPVLRPYSACMPVTPM